MKKNLLTVLSFVLLCSTLTIAQTLTMGTYGVSPRDAEHVDADIFDLAYNGLVNVSVGTQMYFQATVGDESDGGDPEIITPGNLANLVWTLKSQPALSVAALGAMADIDAETQVIVFTPDAKGTYVIEVTDGNNTIAITLNAGFFLGLSDGNCTLCHSTYVDLWAETGHADMLEQRITAGGYYVEGCISCHTVGYDVNDAGNGFDDRDFVFPGALGAGVYDQLVTDYPDAMELANIQCESCHGPAYSHGGATSMAVTLASDNCAWCHDDGTHHVYPEQLDHSGLDAGGFHGGHAIGAFVGYAGNKASCSHCHSGSGFVEWIKGGKVTLTEAPTGTSITCATCHDPHADENAFQLRTLETTLGDGTAITEALYGTGALCMNCHKSRRDAATYAIDVNNASPHYGAHHGPQADMLLGKNAPNFGFDLPTSPHAQAVENACVGCHMYDNSYPDFLEEDHETPKDVGGHTFNMNNHDGVDHVEACADCHGDIGANFADKKYYVNGVADLDGDGTANGLQVEVQGLLDQLAELLPKNDDGEVSITSDQALTTDIMVAGYIYFWVFEDRSLGIHNPAFTISLLKIAIEHAGGITAIDFPEDYNNVPAEFTLAQNYPNPFNPTTTIQFSVPEGGNVKISVYDTIGREVAVLIDRDMSAGTHEVTWDATNMSTGIYFYKMQSNDFVTVKKMLLMK